MTVASILKAKGSDVATVSGATSLSDAARELSKRRIGAVVVCDESGGVAGILSERDIVSAIGGDGVTALEKPVNRYMTSPVITCVGSDTIARVMEIMTKGRFRHVPVVEQGVLLGIISIGDVVKRHIADTESEAEALRDYIATG